MDDWRDAEMESQRQLPVSRCDTEPRDEVEATAKNEEVFASLLNRIDNFVEERPDLIVRGETRGSSWAAQNWKR
jgi:hypothetical protein